MQVVVTDCTDGTYTISLVASCSGEYRMVVSLDGQQVIGSPHMLSVVHGGPAPDDFKASTPRQQVNRQSSGKLPTAPPMPVRSLSPPRAGEAKPSMAAALGGGKTSPGSTTPRGRPIAVPLDPRQIGPRSLVHAVTRSVSQPLLLPSGRPAPSPAAHSALAAESSAFELETLGGAPWSSNSSGAAGAAGAGGGAGGGAALLGHVTPRQGSLHATASMSTPRYLQETTSSSAAKVTHFGRCCNPRQSMSSAGEPREIRTCEFTPGYHAFEGLSRLESQQRHETFARLATPRTREPPPPPTPRDATPRKVAVASYPLQVPGEPPPEYPLQYRGEPPPQGVASAVHSFVSGPSELATARRATLLIAACDGYGVPLQRGGDPFVASVHGPAACHTELRDLEDGRYELHLLAPALSGDYRVTIALRGRPIGGSPHLLTVLAPVAHPAHCEARGTALELATAGELATFELLSHDAHNRPMTYGGEQVSVVNGLLIAPSDGL